MTVSADEGLRAGTTYEASGHPPGDARRRVAAGNASQFSDGAGACVVMNEKVARAEGLKPLGASSASRWPAASPTRWASARSIRRAQGAAAPGPDGGDIDLWELNEAFAVQVLYCATSWASPTGSTSTAAPSPSATLRRQRPAPHRPCAHRGQAAWRQACLVTMHRRRSPGVFERIGGGGRSPAGLSKGCLTGQPERRSHGAAAMTAPDRRISCSVDWLNGPRCSSARFADTATAGDLRRRARHVRNAADKWSRRTPPRRYRGARFDGEHRSSRATVAADAR